MFAYEDIKYFLTADTVLCTTIHFIRKFVPSKR